MMQISNELNIVNIAKTSVKNTGNDWEKSYLFFNKRFKLSNLCFKK